MTYESLHDDDDFRVNWCRNMDSFLLYARGMTTPPPTCRSALHGLPAATGLCATIRLWAATGLRAVTGLSASTSNWAAR